MAAGSLSRSRWCLGNSRVPSGMTSFIPRLARSLERQSVPALARPLACSLAPPLVRSRGLACWRHGWRVFLRNRRCLGDSSCCVCRGWHAILSGRWCQRCLVRLFVRLRRRWFAGFFAGSFAGVTAGALPCASARISTTSCVPSGMLLACHGWVARSLMRPLLPAQSCPLAPLLVRRLVRRPVRGRHGWRVVLCVR